MGFTKNTEFLIVERTAIKIYCKDLLLTKDYGCQKDKAGLIKHRGPQDMDEARVYGAEKPPQTLLKPR